MNYSPSSVLLLCVYTLYNLFDIPLAHPCLYYYLLSPQYTALHISCLFFFNFSSYFIYIYVYSLVLQILHCPLNGPDLTYISLLIISCIIEYVTNKKPWILENLEPGRLLLEPFCFSCAFRDDILHTLVVTSGYWLLLTAAHWIFYLFRTILCKP